MIDLYKDIIWKNHRKQFTSNNRLLPHSYTYRRAVCYGYKIYVNIFSVTVISKVLRPFVNRRQRGPNGFIELRHTWKTTNRIWNFSFIINSFSRINNQNTCSFRKIVCKINLTLKNPSDAGGSPILLSPSDFFAKIFNHTKIQVMLVTHLCFYRQVIPSQKF